MKCMKRQRHLIVTLIAALFISLFTDCRPRSGQLHDTYSGDSINWQDSARTLLVEMTALYNNDEHDSLLKMAPKVLATLREHEQWDEYYMVWHHVINDHIWYNEFAEATKESEAMQKDALERKDTLGMALCYSSQGTGYYMQDNFSEAERSYERAIRLYPKDKKQGPLISTYGYYAKCLSADTNYVLLDSLLTVWHDFIDGIQKQSDSADRADIVQWYFTYYNRLFEYQILTDRLAQAEATLDSIVLYAKESGTAKTIQFKLLSNRFRLAMAQHDYATALGYANEQKRIAGADVSHQQSALGNSADALQKLGRYREAFIDLQAYHALYDSITQTVNREQLNHLNQRYQVNELKSENDLLLQRSRFTTGGLAMIFGTVALLTFLVFSSRWSRKLEIKNKQLRRERNVVVAQNKELAVQRDRAEAASRAKTAFIQSMTHEIRTPLNHISGFTQLLAMPDIELPEAERVEINQQIQEGTRHLTHILDNLIQISDLESASELPPAEDYSPCIIASQVIESVRPLTNAGVVLENKCMVPDEQVVTTHPKMLQTALSKLLDNAVKFTRQGAITLITALNDNRLCFTVQDTGPGIPAEKSEFIFERFAKLDSFTQGTGLGLTVARMIAERLGGTLTLDTSYTAGAKFDLTIKV